MHNWEVLKQNLCDNIAHNSREKIVMSLSACQGVLLVIMSCLCFAFLCLMLYVPVNNFSVLSGRFSVLLG